MADSESAVIYYWKLIVKFDYSYRQGVEIDELQ